MMDTMIIFKSTQQLRECQRQSKERTSIETSHSYKKGNDNKSKIARKNEKTRHLILCS